MAANSAHGGAAVCRRTANSAAEQGLQIINAGVVKQTRILTNMDASLTVIAKCLPQILEIMLGAIDKERTPEEDEICLDDVQVSRHAPC